MFNVVIIDDEEWIRQLIKGLIPWDALEMKVCGEAASGIDGLELCRKVRPDIILTDIRMPGMDGLKLLETLAQDSPAAKVIMISGYDEFSYAQQALKSGAFDYILKPVEETDLVAILNKAKEKIQKEKKAQTNLERLKQEITKLGQGISTQQPEAEYPSNNLVIRKALAHIQQCFNTELTLEEVAATAFINPTYFSELFKQEVGTGFAEYITEIRVEKAKALLKIPELKIVEIAGMVGYRDANYFAKVFKKWIGLTPSEFREQK
ncbi:MAG TPA: DNA-binding response regulator [Firmicutes bacterium]|jgi:two-component system, response regulator YesN|nr:DNA-binding response regulator [Bacillota bacterium]